MLQSGKAVKVTIYLSEGATHHGVPVYQSILDFLFYRGVAGATAQGSFAPSKGCDRERAEVPRRRRSRHSYILEGSTSWRSGNEADDGPTLSIRLPAGIIHFCSLADQY